MMHFIKQPNQFHFKRKLYVQNCVSVSVPFVPNSVVEHVSGFVVCCIQTRHYQWKVPSYLWVMWNTMLVSVYAISVILWGTVTGHNYSQSCNIALSINVFLDFFWQKLLSQNNRSYSREKITKWTQTDLRNIQFYCSFLVSVVFVW